MFVRPDHSVVLVTHDVDSVYFEAIDIGFALDLGVRENCATIHQQSSPSKCAFHSLDLAANQYTSVQP
jgi:hypothetical protein